MPKPVKSLKLTPGKIQQLNAAIDLVEAHVAIVADIWPILPQARRSKTLEHSAVLARFLELAGRLS